MLKQVMLNSCIGKTIKAVFQQCSSETEIVFEDGTFIHLKAEEYYDNLTIEEPEFKITHYRAPRIGVCTQEEYDAALDKIREEQEAERRARELRVLENLMRKYPEKCNGPS